MIDMTSQYMTKAAFANDKVLVQVVCGSFDFLESKATEVLVESVVFRF